MQNQSGFQQLQNLIYVNYMAIIYGSLSVTLNLSIFVMLRLTHFYTFTNLSFKD